MDQGVGAALHGWRKPQSSRPDRMWTPAGGCGQDGDVRSRTTRGHHSRRLAVISAALVVCGAVAILTVKAATSERATSAGRAAEVRGARSPLLRGGAPSSALTERFSVFRLPRIAADDISQRA